MLSVKPLRPRHARAHLSLPRSFRGRMLHALILPFVVVATAELVALAVLPAILSLGRAAQLADSKPSGHARRRGQRSRPGHVPFGASPPFGGSVAGTSKHSTRGG